MNIDFKTERLMFRITTLFAVVAGLLMLGLISPILIG